MLTLTIAGAAAYVHFRVEEEEAKNLHWLERGRREGLGITASVCMWLSAGLSTLISLARLESGRPESLLPVFLAVIAVLISAAVTWPDAGKSKE